MFLGTVHYDVRAGEAIPINPSRTRHIIPQMAVWEELHLGFLLTPFYFSQLDHAGNPKYQWGKRIVAAGCGGRWSCGFSNFVRVSGLPVDPPCGGTFLMTWDRWPGWVEQRLGTVAQCKARTHARLNFVKADVIQPFVFQPFGV